MEVLVMEELLKQLLEGQKALRESLDRIENKIDNQSHEFNAHLKQLDRSLKEHRYVIDHFASSSDLEIRRVKARVLNISISSLLWFIHDGCFSVFYRGAAFLFSFRYYPFSEPRFSECAKKG
jgi:hypothetical protein